MARERIVVVCPGRGTYNAGEWGYLARHHTARAELLGEFDVLREQAGQPGLRALDAETPYSLKLHSRGDHASALIYACAYCDALAIDRDRYEIVAVTGNSMGWYIALAVGAALAAEPAFRLINTMGGLMHTSLIGGQLLQRFVADDWRAAEGARERLLDMAAGIHDGEDHLLYPSIHLGGMEVFGGNARGLSRLGNAIADAGLAAEPYPMRLYNHAAFHTPMQMPVRDTARATLTAAPFQPPEVPLIDGRGHIWTRWSTDPLSLWDYTLGHQLVAPYDFTTAITVAAREFEPDRFVILGPGSTLGGAVAQSLIAAGWRDLADKADFVARQNADPPILSMGVEAQRVIATAA